ncbi:sulfur carrier protein ThiS [Anaerocolumna xylanovorans]|uniref:Sulfur carrier protein n=1 Tax=Anaerocolumna xylanovorans DSM 12503 TaxID=1121345 RepID=A0A1M7Y5J8_9FIRM|nr:sulfur carrier protein ThiS [Anaerocolumna xylanovorans]SHO47709.1 sulfur carrier protein [Anaerocolumna xylanovorans DSM 12503]
MLITISGVRKEVKDGISVTELIVSENVESPEYVSVSVNDDFVLREAFDTTVLKEGDTVELLYFMGGGKGCQ